MQQTFLQDDYHPGGSNWEGEQMNEKKRSVLGLRPGERVFERIRISEEKGKSYRRSNISALYPFRNGIRIFGIAGDHGGKRNDHWRRIPRQMPGV